MPPDMPSDREPTVQQRMSDAANAEMRDMLIAVASRFRAASPGRRASLEVRTEPTLKQVRPTDRFGSPITMLRYEGATKRLTEEWHLTSCWDALRPAVILKLYRGPTWALLSDLEAGPIQLDDIRPAAERLALLALDLRTPEGRAERLRLMAEVMSCFTRFNELLRAADFT